LFQSLYTTPLIAAGSGAQLIDAVYDELVPRLGGATHR